MFAPRALAPLLAATLLSCLACSGGSSAQRGAVPPTSPAGASSTPASGAPDAFAGSAQGAFPYELVPQTGHQLNVEQIAISDDGKVAASASADKTVRVWDVETGILLRQAAIGEQVHGVGFLRDGERAIVCSQYELQLWDLKRGRRLSAFKIGPKTVTNQLRVLRRSDLVVIANSAGGIELWDVVQQKRVRQLAPDRYASELFTDVDVSPDDRTVATCSAEGDITVVDVEGARVRFRQRGHKGYVHAVRFSKDGARLTSFGSDGFLRQWDVANGNELRAIPFGAPIGGGTLVDDDTALVAGYGGDTKVFDLRAGRAVRALSRWPGVPFDGLHAIAVTPDRRRVVAADFHDVMLFSNFDDGSPIHATPRSVSGPFALALAPRGDQVAVSFTGGTIDVWDTALGSRLRRIAGPSNDGQAYVAFSPDGRWLVGTAEAAVSIWDARSGELVRRVKAPRPFIADSLAISPDAKIAAVGGWGTIAAFELETGRLVWTVPDSSVVNAIGWSADGRQLAVGADNQKARLLDAATGAELRQIVGPRSGVDSIQFLDANTALFGANDVTGLWDLRSGQMVKEYSTWRKGGSGFGVFTIDRRWVLTGDDPGMITVFDTASGERRRQYAAHSAEIQGVAPSPDGKLVYTTSFDGTIRITPIATLASEHPENDPRPMVFIGDRSDWLSYSVDGYFDASRRGGSLVAAVRGYDAYRIDQLAVRNNRPDLMLGRLGLGTGEALALFTSRYQQRLRRLGYDESTLSAHLTSAPTATIQEFTRSGRRGHLRCAFGGNGSTLKRYFAYVNDVAVGDAEGTPLSGAQATVDLDIELSSGPNKIEVSAINDVGVESLRDVRTANVPDNVRGSLYYLGFGVSRYADPRLALKFADKDATDLGRVLEQMNGRGFDRVIARTLTDAQVTRASIAAARQFLLQTKVDDTAIVFVAGHGVYGSGANDPYYFVAHDTDVARLRETGAPFDLIEDLVTGIAARKKLLLLDTCESGERDGGDEAVRVSAGQSRGLVARGIRPVVLSQPAGASSRPKRSGLLDRYLYNDLSRRSGTIVFSAAHGNELSYEDDRLQNGLFTYEIVRALSGSSADADRNGIITTDELRSKVTQAVSDRTQGLQNPTVDRDNIDALFGFPVAAPPPIAPVVAPPAPSPAPVPALRKPPAPRKVAPPSRRLPPKPARRRTL